MDNASHNAMHQHRHEGDEYRRIELITGAVRRRRWSAAEKAALVAESLQPGVNVSALARRCGVNRGLLQTWRRAAMREAADGGEVFVPLRVEELSTSADAGTAASTSRPDIMADCAPVPEAGMLEIESGGLRVRFSGPIDAGALRLVLTHLGRRT
jgi:transposase